MNKKSNIFLLISSIIGGAYVLYSIRFFVYYFRGDMQTAKSVLAVQVAFVISASLFTLASWKKNSRPLALTGWILYVLGVMIITPIALFILPSIVLNFIGYIFIDKKEKVSTESRDNTVSVGNNGIETRSNE